MHGWDWVMRLSMQLSLPAMSYYNINIVTSSTKMRKNEPESWSPNYGLSPYAKCPMPLGEHDETESSAWPIGS